MNRNFDYESKQGRNHQGSAEPTIKVKRSTNESAIEASKKSAMKAAIELPKKSTNEVVIKSSGAIERNNNPGNERVRKNASIDASKNQRKKQQSRYRRYSE